MAKTFYIADHETETIKTMADRLEDEAKKLRETGQANIYLGGSIKASINFNTENGNCFLSIEA